MVGAPMGVEKQCQAKDVEKVVEKLKEACIKNKARSDKVKRL